MDPAAELKLFKDAELWDGAFWDSDPLTPVGWSSYSTTGYVSVYHAAYLAAIVPYVKPGFTVMEIGPGRGAWTNAMLLRGAERVYALDVQARETNRIDEVLRDKVDRLTYIVVSDCSGDGVPDGSIDFFWSFGTFVHLSIHQQQPYLNTIFRKMKSGANGFVQIADFDCWNHVVGTPALHVHNVLADRLDGPTGEQVRQALGTNPLVMPRSSVPSSYLDNQVPAPGRYFFVGLDWLVDAVKSAGLEVVERSVMPSLRDPLLHFRKP